MSGFKAKFVVSCPSLAQCPTGDLPEVAMIGRSNVGKSSIINAMTSQRQLAKTSSTPGKTQLLNYFIVNDDFYLVDMPGFGFAKVSKTERSRWASVAESYFLERANLRAVGLLIDSRHPGLEADGEVVQWFTEQGIPFFIVLTKADKVKQSDLAQHQNLLRTLAAPIDVIITSAEKKLGVDKLRGLIKRLVAPIEEV